MDVRQDRRGRLATRSDWTQHAPMVALLGGAAVLVGGLVCLYSVMRTVGLEHGGSCSTGGPYEINPGQQCQDGLFALAIPSVVAMLVGAFAHLWGSFRYGAQLVCTSGSGLLWCAFNGWLGGSFLAIAADMPPSPTEGEFTWVGWMFVVLGLLGLPVVVGPFVYGERTERKDIAKPARRVWLVWAATTAAGAVLGLVAGRVIVAAVG